MGRTFVLDTLDHEGPAHTDPIRPEPVAVTVAAVAEAIRTLRTVSEAGDALPEAVIAAAGDAEELLARAFGDGELRGAVVDDLARWSQDMRRQEAAARGEAKYLAAEMERVKAKADAFGGRAEYANRIAADGMRLAKVTEARGKVYRFSVQQVGGKLALLIPDAAVVPLAWRKPVPAPGEMPPDNDRIRAELERDGAVPGCSLRPRGEKVVLK
jgi:hypothetical protein